MTATPEPRFSGDDVVRLAAIAWCAVAVCAWWSVLEAQWSDDVGFGLRDFYCFQRAGLHLIDGDSSTSPYDYEFVYPPVALLGVAPLGLVSVRTAYVLLAALGSALWLLGCRAAAALGEATSRRRSTLTIAAVTAPGFFFALHLGQLTGFYMAVVAGTLLLLSQGRERPAALVAALLVAKPHFLVPIVLAAAILRRCRFVGTACLVVGTLLLASTLFGPAMWHDWWSAFSGLTTRHDAHADRYWKQVTLLAFLRAELLPIDAGGWLARSVYLASLAAFAAPLFWVLRAIAARAHEPVWMARAASVVVLTLVGLNTYLFYYDAALLALPAITLFTASETWRRPVLRRIAIGCALLSWLTQLETGLLQTNPPLGGVLAVVWLVTELIDLWPASSGDQARTSTSLVISGGV